MKALCVKPEFAEMIASGEKDIEYRSWRTKYRGKLLIVATKPVGKAVAVCELVDCVQNEDGEWEWLLENARPIKPFPVKGQLGLFEVAVPSGR